MEKGVSLVELLIGIALFSLVLTAAARGLGISQETLAVSNRQLPVEIALQNAVDSADRCIRGAADVSGGGTSLMLTLADGSVRQLSFANGSLMWGGDVLQSRLGSASFSWSQGGVAKFVTMTFTAQPDPQAGTPKILTSSASLRSLVAAAAPLPPPVAAPPPPVPAPPPPAPLPPPPPPPDVPMAVVSVNHSHGTFGGGGSGWGGGSSADFWLVLLTTQRQAVDNPSYDGSNVYGYYGNTAVYLDPKYLVFKDLAGRVVAPLQVDMEPSAMAGKWDRGIRGTYVPVSTLWSNQWY